MSKKIVVKLELHDGKDKQKAMKAVSALVGIDALSVDMAAHKMTVVGTVDPVDVVSKLLKSSLAASIDSVGPAKEPEKEKEKDGAADAKKEGEGEKKDGSEAKKDGEYKENDEGKKDVDGEKKTPTPPPPTEQQLVAELMNQYRAYQYNPYMSAPHYVQSMEENPNSCAIC